MIQVHGCFWHGHKGCKYFVIPKTRTKWWKEKIEGNIERDQIAEKELKSEGWKVIVIWECELKADKHEKTLASLVKSIYVTNKANTCH